MTIQDLKANRKEIINTITKSVGADKVAEVMKQMVNGLDCCETMEELISEAIYHATQFEVKIEKSRNAFIIGKLAEMEN